MTSLKRVFSELQSPGNGGFFTEFLRLALIAIAYLIAVRTGLLFMVKPESIASIWPPSGVALAVLLLSDKRKWALILFVIFATNTVGNFTGGNSLPVSLCFALVNIIEPAIGAWILTFFFGSRITFANTGEVLTLCGVAVFSNGFTALLGATIPKVFFGAPFFDTWFVWWISDGLGIILITPIIITWVNRPDVLKVLPPHRLIEIVVLFAVMLVFTLYLLPFYVTEMHQYLHLYTIFPLLIWAALRFGPGGTATTIFVFSSIILWDTIYGFNGSGLTSMDLKRSVLIIQILIIIVAPAGLILAAVIAERKQAEKELKEFAQRLAIHVEQTPLGVIEWDLNFKVTQWNKAAENIFGYSRKEAIGQTGLELVVPKEVHNLVQPIWNDLVSGRGGTRSTNENITKDGKAIICDWYNTTLLDSNGVAIGVASLLQDITDRQYLEESKTKLERQLQQSQKIESIGRLAGGVAHDFNNMLSIILGNTEMIMEDLDSENPVISNLDEIHKAAERSSHLTHQLLAFARKQTISPKALDLNDTIEGMLKMLRRLIGENIDLTWLPKINLWAIKFDTSQVDQILANLCVNARDSIKDVGKVTIETDNMSFDKDYIREHDGFKPGDYVMMAISDNGCGMDKAILDNLFEPFFTTKGVGEGTGLGLATVYGIVKQNNGFINVFSEPNKGTTFRIYFPRHAEKDLPKQKSELKEADARGSETILVVEDEEAILKMTAMMLERLGYTVLTASNPIEAINILKSHSENINLLMTDVIMPEMNGRDLAKKMFQIFPNLKCLFMSGYTANVIAHHGVLNSGMQFIQKPFSRQGLAKKVREVLDEEKKQVF